MKQSSGFFVTCVMLLAVLGWVPRCLCAAELLVELQDVTTVRSTQVLLRDVAKLTCEDPAMLANAEAVEVRLLDLTHESEDVTAWTVKSRLVLAGWSLPQFSITGSPLTKVLFQEPQPLTDAELEKEALKAMVRIMSVEEKDLNVRLQSAFMQSLRKDIRERDGLRVEITPPRKALGMVVMKVQVWHDKELLVSQSASFDVRKRQRVAIAKVSLTREMPLDERSVQFENRFLATEMDELDSTQVLGQRVRSGVVAGTVIQMRDIQTSRSGIPLAVRKGEAVRVLVVAGPLQTILRDAEALQDGGVGESIKLKNRDSGQEIVGKVVGPGMVRIFVK